MKSPMPGDDHYRLFDRISFFYNWFFPYQVRWYRTIIGRNMEFLNGNTSFLDVGCGTGAFAYALRERGFDVTGVDRAASMVRRGHKNDLPCIIGDIFTGLPFRDKTFNVVSAAYVAHGFPSEQRIILYRECARIARNMVLFHDFNQVRRLSITLIEKLEGSDYVNFIQSVPEEMKSVFSSVREIKAGPVNSWYLCEP